MHGDGKIQECGMIIEASSQILGYLIVLTLCEEEHRFSQLRDAGEFAQGPSSRGHGLDMVDARLK